MKKRQWIKADRAIIGDGKTVISPACIGIDGEFIFEAGSQMPQTEDDTVLDLGDVTLIPGLMNLHDHIYRKSLRVPDASGRPFGEASDALTRQDGNLLTLYAADNMKKYLYDEGITFVRDLGMGKGSNLAVRNAIKIGLIEGPEITTSIHPIAMTGGHGSPFSYTADGADAVVAAVREMARQGADIIKFMGSGGLKHYPREQPKYSEYTLTELRAGAEAAHDRGLDTSVHAYSAESVRRAVEAGIDVIEHGAMMEESSLNVMAEKGIAWNPTLSGIREAVKFGPNVKFWDRLSEELFSVQEQALRKAHEMGTILIGTGTDTMGFLADEIELIRAVLNETPVQAIAHATSISAKIVKRDDLGLLAKGKRACMAAVKGDLTKSLSSLKGGVVCTWKDGIAYKR